MNPNTTHLDLGFIGVGNYGGTLLEGLLLSLERTPGLPISRIVIYDKDPKRTHRFAAASLGRVHVASCAEEVLQACELHIIGVNSSELSALFRQLRLDNRSNYTKTEEFLFMDGCKHVAELEAMGNLRFGKIMFTPWAKYCEGVVSFWQGSLSSHIADLAQIVFSTLGDFWLTEDPEFLQKVRASAGCGIGFAAALLEQIRQGFMDIGLSPGQAEGAIKSLVRGMNTYLQKGGSISDLPQLITSRENSLTRAMLDSAEGRSAIAGVLPAFRALNKNVSHDPSAEVANAV